MCEGISNNRGHIQHAGMVIVGYIEAGQANLAGVITNELEQKLKITMTNIFEATTTLTRHFEPHTHILRAIEKDGNTVVVVALLVAMSAFNQRPRTSGHTKQIHNLLRSMNDRRSREPVYQDEIFHKIHPPRKKWG